MKQLRIAICDDDNQDLLQITSLVEAYKEKNKTDITFIVLKCYDLLEPMSSQNEYAPSVLITYDCFNVCRQHTKSGIQR